MSERKEKRYFSREFKRDAVLLVIDRGLSVKEVAKDLDIHPNMLTRWRREYLGGGSDFFSGNGRVNSEEAERDRLRRELSEVKEEGDI